MEETDQQQVRNRMTSGRKEWADRRKKQTSSGKQADKREKETGLTGGKNRPVVGNRLKRRKNFFINTLFN